MNSDVLESEHERSEAVPSNASAIAPLDMAEIISFVRSRETLRRELPQSVPDVCLHRLGRPVAELTLNQISTAPPFLQLRPSHERMLPVHVSKLHSAGRPPVAITLRQLDRDIYRVLMAPPHGAAQPIKLDIPAGLPRVTNVATLKAMVSAGSSDVVFRRAGDGERWEVCSDEYPVDLEDRTQVFKIREMAILS